MAQDDERRAPSRDHVLRARVRGGTLADPGNRLIVCRGCNEDKGTRSLAGFLQRLLNRDDPRAAFVRAVIVQFSNGGNGNERIF